MGISSKEMYTIYDSTKECETNLSTFIIISANELNSIRASCMVFWDWNGNQNIPDYSIILLNDTFSQRCCVEFESICMAFWDWNGNQNIPEYFRILLKGIFSLYLNFILKKLNKLYFLSKFFIEEFLKKNTKFHFRP